MIMLSPTSFLFSAAAFAVAVGGASDLERRAGCNDNFSKCNPKGASSTNTPVVGTDLSPLYTDLINSVQGVNKVKRESVQARDELGLFLEARDSSTNLCCQYLNRDFLKPALIVYSGADGTLCLNLQGLNLPFCYVSRTLISAKCAPLNKARTTTPPTTFFREVPPVKSCPETSLPLAAKRISSAEIILLPMAPRATSTALTILLIDQIPPLYPSPRSTPHLVQAVRSLLLHLARS